VHENGGIGKNPNRGRSPLKKLQTGWRQKAPLDSRSDLTKSTTTMSEEERIEAAEAEVSLFSFDNDNYCNDFDGFLPMDSFFRRDCIDFFF